MKVNKIAHQQLSYTIPVANSKPMALRTDLIVTGGLVIAQGKLLHLPASFLEDTKEAKRVA